MVKAKISQENKQQSYCVLHLFTLIKQPILNIRCGDIPTAIMTYGFDKKNEKSFFFI